MDISDEEDYSLTLLAEEKLKDLKKPANSACYGGISHVIPTLN